MPGAFDTTPYQTHDILNAMPKWYIRYGMLLLLFVLGVLLLVSLRVRYPVTVTGTGYVHHVSGDTATYFVVQMPQRLLSHLQPGTSAGIALDAWPGVADGSGVVDEIPTLRGADGQAVVRIRIQRFDAPAAPLKDSLSGTAVFLLGESSLFRQLFQ
jgi:hypothetical protein